MALTLGQLLGGAGVVGQGWREEEDAQRRSREIELRTAELNRLDRLRQEMLQAPMPTPVAVPQFGPIAQLPVAGAPAAPAAQAAPAAAPAVTAPTQPVPTAQAAPTSGAQAFPVPPQPTITSRPLTPLEQQQTANRIALGRVPAAALDVFQAPGAAALNLASQGARGINYLFGTELPTPSFSYTPFYDKYVRQPEQELAAGTKRVVTVSGVPETAPPTAPRAQLPDPQRLLQAMIQVESAGKPDAVSAKGAVGLMQVKPETAMKPGYGVPSIFDFVAQQAGGEYKGKRNAATAAALLKDPQIGAAYGQRYMDAMLQKYDGNLEYALAAYNAGPGRIDNWLSTGADPAKLPKETRDYVPKVLGALGIAPTQTTAPAAAAPTAPAPVAGLNIPGVSAAQAAAAAPAAAAPTPATPAAVPTPVRSEADFYLANPQSIPLDMQRAMQQRAEVERLAGMYQRAGMGAQFMEARAKLMELDNGMTYLQGMQGLQEFTLANDPRRLAAVWSQYAGVPVGIQPRTDGKFDIVVNGRKTKTGVTASDIADSARSAFDATYRQQKGAASAKYNEEQFKTQLEIQKNNAQQLAQMIRELAVQRAQGNAQLAVEQLKQFRYDVKPTGAGDGTVIITPPGSGTPYLFNPSGRTIEVDGVKITSNSAYPIAGLPTYGGVQTR